MKQKLEVVAAVVFTIVAATSALAVLTTGIILTKVITRGEKNERDNQVQQ